MSKKAETNKWETGELGRSAEHVKFAPAELELDIDDALGLQLVSVRLQKKLIKDLKELAKKEGLGYQPYLRQILTNHVSKKKAAV